ncbi:hypothetical protein Ate01nite_62270 [Actinoplanes teichomyceticus]|nr:hypothetical protein Ate01nite_62270 [Actinoplanes teichomyceticus]
MQMHVHSRVPPAPVWTIPGASRDPPVPSRRDPMSASNLECRALGYERAAGAGSPAYRPCDTVTGGFMIKRRHIDRRMTMRVSG